VLDTSVCSGALILAAAGILDGEPATTHWAVQAGLAAMGARPCRGERYVQTGKIVTSAGVPAGIDLALWLVGQIAGRERAETIQLYLEYDPHPPFNPGHPTTASPAVVQHATRWRAASRSTPPNCTPSRSPLVSSPAPTSGTPQGEVIEPLPTWCPSWSAGVRCGVTTKE
jgi:hypothetical protein